MKKIILTCTFLLVLIGVGVSASINTQIYLPIVYNQATPTAIQVTPTPSGTPFPPGVQILPVSFVYKSGNMMNIVGEVLNNTSESLYGVAVTVNFFNSLGYFIDSSSTLLTPYNLPVRERGCFSIIMDYPLNWSYYIFDTPTYDIGSSSPDLTYNGVNGWYNPDRGDYEIIGQVINGGLQISYNVSVGGTLYNASNEPVGCSDDVVDTINLDPGGTSTFDLFYDGLNRDYSDVTHYRLRVTGDLP